MSVDRITENICDSKYMSQRLLLALPFGAPFLDPGVSIPTTAFRLHGPTVVVPVVFAVVLPTSALAFVGGDTIILFSKVSISPVVGTELCSSAVDAAWELRRSVCSKSASSCKRWIR